MIVEYHGLVFPVPFDPDFRLTENTEAQHIDDLNGEGYKAFMEAARYCDEINSI